MGEHAYTRENFFEIGWYPMNRMTLLILLVFTCSQSFGAVDFKAKVIKIADGDTITVLREGSVQIKIRLADIDCPERGQPWGRNATDALKNALTSDTVGIEVLDKDRYGRTIARVYLNSVSINRYMVESGNCWVYTKYAKDQELFGLQDGAKTAERGLWQLPESERVPPWEWRKKK